MKLIVGALIACALSGAASAQNYTTSVTIGYDPNAPTSNFSNPGTTNSETAYTVRTGNDGTNFLVDLTTVPGSGNDLSAYDFANVYVGGANLNPGLIFEVTNDRVSTTSNPSNYYSLAGTGFTYSSTGNPVSGTLDISFSLPFSFLENDPLGIGFSKLSPGDQVRVSYTQAFGYSFDGGSAAYGSNRLGAQIIPATIAAAAPEPATWAMMILGFGFVGFAMRRGARRSDKKTFHVQIKRIAGSATA